MFSFLKVWVLLLFVVWSRGSVSNGVRIGSTYHTDVVIGSKRQLLISRIHFKRYRLTLLIGNADGRIRFRINLGSWNAPLVLFTFYSHFSQKVRHITLTL